MAEASHLVRCLEDITACPICAEDYTDPRCLPCVHTFCLQCISRWGRDLQPGDKFDCPLCRSEVQVPAVGFAGFPKNFFIDELIEARKLSSGKKLCDVCVDDRKKPDDEKLVTVYCAECEQSLCQQCANCHTRHIDTKVHRLVETTSTEATKTGVQTLKLTESFCQKHRDVCMECYCFDCSLPVCMMCMHESHQSHKTGSVKAVAEELGERIKATFGGLAGTVDKCKKMQQQLDKVIQQNEDDVNKTEGEINKRADDLKQLVDQIRDSLVLELRTAKKCQDKKVKTLREELEGQIMMVESFRKYSEELLSKGTCCDIVRSASDLENRARELMKFSEQINVDKLHVDVKFSVNTVNITDIKQLFGHVKFTTSSLLVTLTGPEDSRVSGLTKLANKLYVVYYKSDTINVYTDQQPFTQLPSIKVDGLINPSDTTACNINNCLYVVDFEKCVWRVKSDDIIDKWLEVFDIMRLSVTFDGLVVILVATDIEGTGDSETWLGRVLVYNAAGVQLTNIKLPNSIINPWGVVQTRNTTLTVSHGGYMTELNRVCEVNSEGNIIATFGGSPGSELGQLATPSFITLDSEERVLVADGYNHRVVLLNRQLDTQLRVLLSWNNNLSPWHLFYDEDTKQLIVGFKENGRVDVYSLSLKCFQHVSDES